jgi:hypothetical protein
MNLAISEAYSSFPRKELVKKSDIGCIGAVGFSFAPLVGRGLG